MNKREVPGDVGRCLVAKIISSYVKHNRVAANELQTMIASVHQSLSRLGKASTPTEALTRPCRSGDRFSRSMWSASNAGFAAARSGVI